MGVINHVLQARLSSAAAKGPKYKFTANRLHVLLYISLYLIFYRVMVCNVKITGHIT